MTTPLRPSAALFLALALCAALAGPIVHAHEEDRISAVTSDGRLVELRVDHTWDFVEMEESDPDNSAVLTVTELVEMQDACGVRSEWLPALFESVEVSATLSGEAARATGLQGGIPIAAGGGDQAAQAVGSLAVGPPAS